MPKYTPLDFTPAKWSAGLRQNPVLHMPTGPIGPSRHCAFKQEQMYHKRRFLAKGRGET